MLATRGRATTSRRMIGAGVSLGRPALGGDVVTRRRDRVCAVRQNLEARLRNKGFLEPIWRAAGWDGTSSLTLHRGSSPMESRRTLVVTYDVRPRRACPAPLGQVTASPGERGAPNTAGASAAPLVQHTLMLSPTGTIERGTATQHASLGEGPMSYRAFLPRRTATERELGLLAKAARRHTTGANSAVACGGLKPFNV